MRRMASTLHRRSAHGCCHVPDAVVARGARDEGSTLERSTAKHREHGKPELWEGRAPRELCREHAFEFDVARTRFGRGVLAEVGWTARNLGLRRVAVVSDSVVATQPFFQKALDGLADAGVDAAVFLDTKVEPTDESFLEAARWALDVQPDGWISIGGGSCIDTCKAANLFSTHPPPSGLDDFLHYVNASPNYNPVPHPSPNPEPNPNPNPNHKPTPNPNPGERARRPRRPASRTAQAPHRMPDDGRHRLGRDGLRHLRHQLSRRLDSRRTHQPWIPCGPRAHQPWAPCGLYVALTPASLPI